MNCSRCCNIIEPLRLEALPDTTVCISCAQKGHNQKQIKGIMCFDHKTGGTMQVVSPDNFSEYRRYNPYGRYTGRGSGVHRVSRASEHI